MVAPYRPLFLILTPQAVPEAREANKLQKKLALIDIVFVGALQSNACCMLHNVWDLMGLRVRRRVQLGPYAIEYSPGLTADGRFLQQQAVS